MNLHEGDNDDSTYNLLGRDYYIRKLESERWIIHALFQILKEHGIQPSSTELIAAKRRSDLNTK